MAKLENLSSNISCMRDDIESIKASQHELSIQVASCSAKIAEHDRILMEQARQVEACTVQLSSLDSGLSLIRAQIGQVTPHGGLNSPTSTNELLIEIEERKRRSRNIMVYNLPIEKDVANVLIPINLMLSEIDPDLKAIKALRVGGKNTSGASLKITMETSELATKILKNRNKISNKNVKLHSDLTPMQIQHLKDLREELNHRNSNGENLTIKYINGVPKIVKASKDNLQNMVLQGGS